MRCRTKTPRLKQASLREKYQGLVQVDERRPDLVPVTHKHLFCPRKQFDCLKCLSLAAGRDGGKAQCFRGFITKAELVKAFIRRSSQFASLGAQIQFKIDFGKVKIAERKLIGIVRFLCAKGCFAKQLNRTTVLPAQKI